MLPLKSKERTKGLKQFLQTLQQRGILLRKHEAEPEIAVVQEREGGAVADHQSLADCVLKEVVGCDVLFFNPGKKEIGCGPVDFQAVPGGKLLVRSGPVRRRSAPWSYECILYR